MRRVGLLLAVIVSLVTLGVTIGVLFERADGGPGQANPVRQKSFSRLVAEGVRYRDTRTLGADRFAFKSCRVEKRRRGPITLGAYNVLVVEDLVVNLPVAGGGCDAGGGPAAEGFAETFLRAQGLGVGRCSGMRINGLTVNRCCSNRVEAVFSAAQAESGMGKDGLRLRECVVSTPDGKGERVRQARLVLTPEPTLSYLRDGVEQRVGL